MRTWTVVWCLAPGLIAAAQGGAAGPALPEVTAASPAVADIQAAAEQLPDGGVIRIPEGRAEAVGTLVVPGGIRLAGAGAEKTVLFRGPATGAKENAPIVRIEGANGKPVRITGLGLVGVLDPESASWDTGIYLRDCLDFRVDHCRLQRFGMAGVSVNGRSRGVVDHCLFVGNYKKAIANVGYGVCVMGTGRWRDEAALGSADAVFIEDCEFIGSRHAVASNAGAHYVFRHNHVHGNDVSHAVDAHGPGYGSAHGTQWVEVYDNVVEKPAGGTMAAVVIRGGGGVLFNNALRDYRAGIWLTLDYDVKIDWSRPYPIPEQVRDLWCWGNTLDGRPAEPVVPTRSANHIKAGRDYHLAPRPGYRPFTYPHPLTAPP